MKKGLLLPFFGVLFNSGVLAQTNFHPGYVVTLSGDTLRGEVDLRGAQYNARLSRFRPSAAAPVTEYRPAQLRGYGLAHAQVFQTGRVALPDTLHHLAMENAAPDTVRRPAFLQALVLGPATLLYLRDFYNKDHYYVRVGAGGPVQELVSTTSIEKVNGVSVTRHSDEYKHTLAAAMGSCLAVQPVVNGLRYAESSLADVVRRYNACVGGTSVAPADESRRNRVRLALILGGQQSQLDHDLNLANIPGGLTHTRMQSAVAPVVGLGLQMQLAGVTPSLSARVEATYNAQSFSSDQTANDPPLYTHTEWRTQLRGIAVPLLARYTVQTRHVRPFVQAGYCANFLLKLVDERRVRYATGGNLASNNYGEWYPVSSGTRRLESGLIGGLGLTTARATGRNLSLEFRFWRTNGFIDYNKSNTDLNRYFLLLSYDLTK